MLPRYCHLTRRVICTLLLNELVASLCAIVPAAALVILSQSILLVKSQAVRADDEIKSVSETIVKEIADCLSQRGEYLVDPKEPTNRCIIPRGNPPTNPGLPFNVSRDEIDKICRDNDRRALSGDLIKRIVALAKDSIGPMGIRIIGGVYCNQLDLAGLDLPYSLILDRAVFTNGIAARNLRVKGDFSFDGALVFGYLTLNRAHIDGSFYHGSGFIEREIITDTKIEGTWHQSGTVIFSFAQFQGIAVSGDIDLSDSALGRFSIDTSQVRGGLILNDSEARCSYDIKTSDFGLVLAERAGFGTATTKDLDGNLASGSAASVYPWWLKFWTKTSGEHLTEGQQRARELLASPAVHDLVYTSSRQCPAESAEARIRFAVLETHVRTNMCLRSFTWLYWPSKEYDVAKLPESAVILNGTNVDVGLIVLFNPEKLDSATSSQIRARRSLEAKGLTAGSLIFEFSEDKSSYATQLDGLKFGRIHSNLANCEFKSETLDAKSSGTSGRPRPPTVQQVVTWLTRNKDQASSSQPFTAFAEAFEGIGEDASALRVAQSSQELWDRTADWWKTPPFPRGSSFASFRATFLDTIPIAFQWGLRIVADHGYRPGKVVYFVLITLLVFWLIFWFWLKIVAFGPEDKKDTGQHVSSTDHAQEDTTLKEPTITPRLLPIGFLFLFDRLIPAFQIREENYSIGTVYGRRSRFFKFWSKQKPLLAGESPTYDLKYLSMSHIVVPLGEKEKDRFKKWLIVLRVIGVAWGVFLLAALNALIKH